MLQASPTIQESNMLEGALSTKIEFEDQRFNEIKGMRSKIFLFLELTEMVKELVQVSMVIIFLQHFKIRGRVFFNQCEQGLITML